MTNGENAGERCVDDRQARVFTQRSRDNINIFVGQEYSADGAQEPQRVRATQMSTRTRRRAAAPNRPHESVEFHVRRASNPAPDQAHGKSKEM
jgi:hypothetical protein